MAIPAIHEHAGEWHQKERRHLAGESDDAEEKSRVRTAETKYELARGDLRHPTASQRNTLTDEEEAEVAVREGARH